MWSGFGKDGQEWQGRFKTGELTIDSLDIAPESELSTNSFDIFTFGKDELGMYSELPFVLSWDHTTNCIKFHDGSYSSYLNLCADLTSHTINNTGTITSNLFLGGQATLNGTSRTEDILRVTGTSNSINQEVTFTYVPSQTFTVTIASPAVFTTPLAHTLSEGAVIILSTTGALPTGLTANGIYYARNPSGTTFNVSATISGALINTSGTQSGTHTVRPAIKATTSSAHGLTANSRCWFAVTGGTLPTGLSTATNYYVPSAGLTTTSFYPVLGTIATYTKYPTVSDAGSGSPYVYGHNTNYSTVYNSPGTLMSYFDKYGALKLGEDGSAPCRIGVVPTSSDYSGIHFGTNATSPTTSNYGFLGDSSNTFFNAPSNMYFRIGNATQLTVTSSALTVTDAKNLVLGSTTGNKIGTATTQKLGLWNATPIVQPTTAVAGATRTGGGGTNVTDTDTFDGYTIAQVVKALRNIGALA
jgi:hypothetical protein